MSYCCQALDLAQRERAAAQGLHCGQTVACARMVLARRSSDVALRCAWLRVHAEDLRPFDPTGQLSAELRDFADLLEVAEERGWFA